MYKQQGEPTIYIIEGFIDFRSGIDSLCYKIKAVDPNIDLTGNNLFIFVCKTKDKIKLLYWGGDGFWLILHRLEESKFKWIKKENSLVTITKKQLERLLEELEMNPKTLHKEVKNKVFYS